MLLILSGGVSTAWYLTRQPPRNVIIVIIDTLRRDALGCYGNPHNPSPNIDALAEEGVRFDQAVSTSGWTLPAVASLLTGTWPQLHGAMGKDVALTMIRAEVPTAAEVLRNAGFNTLGFANAAFVSPMLGFDRGFDLFDHRYAYNWKIRRADETIDAALKELHDRSSESNFLLIHVFDPHLDYDPPQGYAAKHTSGRSDPPPPLTHQVCLDLANANGPGGPTAADIDYIKSVYLGEVDFVDAQVGRLVDELKSMGLYDRTTLIITSDHGEEFWDHGGFEHGRTLYDELVHIPLVVKLPREAAVERSTVGAQVRIIDIMPTVFDILGVRQPASFLGASLMPLMRGESSEDRTALCESTLYGADKIAIRSSQYKFIRDSNPAATQIEELYDWRVDPKETNNLINARPNVAKRLRAELMKARDDLDAEARNMSTPQAVDMSPRQIERLRSLGYIGR